MQNFSPHPRQTTGPMLGLKNIVDTYNITSIVQDVDAGTLLIAR